MSPSESSSSLDSRLPANLLLNLVPLTLVCLQRCASRTSSSGPLEVDSSDSTSSIASLVNKDLFEATVELLVSVPEIVTDMLSLLQKITSGMEFLTVIPPIILYLLYFNVLVYYYFYFLPFFVMYKCAYVCPT